METFIRVFATLAMLMFSVTTLAAGNLVKHSFPTYGFGLNLDKSVDLTCYQDFMRTPSNEKVGSGGFGTFCITRLVGNVRLLVGWMDPKKTDPFTNLAKYVNGQEVLSYLGEGIGFDFVPDNKLNLQAGLDKGFNAGSFGNLVTVYTCLGVKVEGVPCKDKIDRKYNMYFLVFRGSAFEKTGAWNWIAVGDFSNPSSATRAEAFKIVQGLVSGNVKGNDVAALVADTPVKELDR